MLKMTFRLMAQRMLPRNVVVSVVRTITSDASGGSASQCRFKPFSRAG
jgi:hypothetical protein